VFTGLGGESVVLRLGWTCGPGEPITRRVLSAARLGWRLVDGDPAAWVAMIAEPDAASAVLPALTVPPGIYNVTDGAPVTQGMLNTGLEAALGRPLHSLNDPGWGRDGSLFGFSRRIADARFGDLTGWRPRVAPAAGNLCDLL
jgi:nucleoside-diphosphate-sugar epimerase